MYLVKIVLLEYLQNNYCREMLNILSRMLHCYTNKHWVSPCFAGVRSQQHRTYSFSSYDCLTSIGNCQLLVEEAEQRTSSATLSTILTKLAVDISYFFTISFKLASCNFLVHRLRLGYEHVLSDTSQTDKNTNRNVRPNRAKYSSNTNSPIDNLTAYV